MPPQVVGTDPSGLLLVQLDNGQQVKMPAEVAGRLPGAPPAAPPPAPSPPPVPPPAAPPQAPPAAPRNYYAEAFAPPPAAAPRGPVAPGEAPAFLSSVSPGEAPPPPPVQGQPGAAAPPQPTLEQELRTRAIQQKLRPTVTPGVNPQRMLATGVMVPTGATQKVEGGIDPEAAERAWADRQEIASAAAGAQAQAFRTQQALADREAQRAEDEALAYKQDLLNRQAQLEQMQTKHKANVGILQQQVDAAGSREADPGRLFANMSAPQAIAGVLGLAILQGVSARTGAPNPMWSMIQHAVDRDVDSQERALERGYRGKALALQQYLDDYKGDMDLAKFALRAAQESYAQSIARRYAAASKSPEIQANFAQWMATTADKELDAWTKFQQASMGKITREMNQQFVVPKAPTVGRTDYAGAAEEAAKLGAGGGLQYAGALEEAKAAGKARGEMAGGLTPEVAEKRFGDYGKVIEDVADARTKLDIAMQALGGKVVKQAGGGPGELDFTGAKMPGAGFWADVAMTGHVTEAGRRTQQALKNLGNAYIKAVNKGSISDKDVPRILAGLWGHGTEEEIKNGLQTIQAELNARVNEAQNMAGKRTVERWEASAGQMSAERARKGESAQRLGAGLRLGTGG